ncbi:MAG: M1 family aminopeptidase [Flavobacteriales bacterium]
MRPLLPLMFCLVWSAAQAQVGYNEAPFNALVHSEQQHHGVLKSDMPPTRGFDMKYARCHWNLDPAVRYISGNVMSKFTAMVDLDQLVFDISDSLTIDSVSYHGSLIAFSQDGGNLLTISLPATIPTGAFDSVAVTYHGVPPNTGFGSFVTSQHNGTPIVWTLSEPYGARDWWPCKQDLNDKIDSMDTYITTADAYRAAGNGVLVDSASANGQTTWHWRERYPIDPYLVATAVTNYQVDIRYAVIDGDSIPMVTYAYPENFYAATLNADDVLGQMTLYSQLFGLYPFANEKYGHAQFGWGGGMEHQTMTFLGAFQYELAAHELGHQWFGDKVTCGSWQDIWLNEGFATYLTGLCYDYLVPIYWQGWKQAKINDITSQPGGSVLCTDTLDQNRLWDSRLTYNKGAMVIHMLRWVCGDSAFYQGLRNYLDDPALAYGTALTNDLETHLEATSGLDLSQFFADWYVGEGYPIYTTVWNQNSNGDVTVNLSQTTSHPSVSFFAMPVPIRFSGEGMDSTVVLQNTANNQQFTFHLPFTVGSVVFDPDLWLISANDVVTRVSEIADGEHELVLYPNPARDKISWRAIGSFHGAEAAKVIDALGRAVITGDARSGSFDISGLAPGSYLLELTEEQSTLRSRFIKR